MLLRETCLMSMVSKRVSVTEVCPWLFALTVPGHVSHDRV